MKKLLTITGIVTLTLSLVTSSVSAQNSLNEGNYGLDSASISSKTLVSTSSGTNIFKDVPMTHWAHSAIRNAVANGYFKGYSDGTFRPNVEVTREEFAVLMSRVSNNPVNVGTTVPGIEGRWSEMEIKMAIGQGFINPNTYANGFGPSQAVNRLEMATWLVNGLTAKYPTYAKAKSELQNGLIPVAEFYKGGLGQVNYGTVGIAVGTGMLTGFQDGTFGPSKTTTRAEVAVLLLRYSNLQNKAPDEFPWLNEMREIATTGTNMVSKGFTFSTSGERVNDFSQIKDVTFTVGSGTVTSVIRRLVVVDFNGDPNNPMTKLFMGTKTNDPFGSYAKGKSLVLLEIETTPKAELLAGKFNQYFQSVGYIMGGDLKTNAPQLYGLTTLPGYTGWTNPSFFKAGVTKRYWTATAFSSQNIDAEGVTTVRIQLPDGQYLSATPSGK